MFQRITGFLGRDLGKALALSLLWSGLFVSAPAFGQTPRPDLEPPPPAAAPVAAPAPAPKPPAAPVAKPPAPPTPSAAALAASGAPAPSAEPVAAPSASVEVAAPAPSAEPEPSAAPAPSEAAPPALSAEPVEAPVAAPAPVPAFSAKLGDDAVFALRAAVGNKPPEARAKEASEQLKRAYDTEPTSVVTVARRGDAALLTVGHTFIVELTEEEAKLAGATSLDAHAAFTASAIQQKLLNEHKRAAVAKSAFSFSLVVFFGLIAFYLIGQLGAFAERGRGFIEARSDKDLSIRFQGIEFVRPAVLRSTGVLALSTLKWLAQAGVVYTWLVVSLSLFESTRDYTQKLTGFVVAPLSQLMGRLATALPLLVVAVLAALAVFVLVRFVGVFFASVGRGEAALGWLPSEFAAPVSVILRTAIVLCGLVFLAPLVTGDNDSVLARIGMVAIVALGLAFTPLLASGAVGAVWLFGRRLRVGEYVELGAYRGRVAEINLLELRLTVTDRTELRVPHLLTLTRPLRLLGARPRLTLDVYVHAGSSVTEVRTLLANVANKVGSDPSVEIVSADLDGIRFRIAATCDSLEARTAFHIAALDALSAASISLGRDRS